LTGSNSGFWAALRQDHCEFTILRASLCLNFRASAVEEYFGPIEPKRGPGRPPIGRAIQVRLPDGLLARVHTFAGELNRAEAVRILLDAALVNAEQVDSGSTHGDRR
jgi:hypothetical protein